MLVPGQWHHLTVVMAKDMKKSCVTTAYFNGKAVGTGKVRQEEVIMFKTSITCLTFSSPLIDGQMKYIQQFPGHYVSMDPTAVIDVYGVMGTPAPWKEHAALVWRVGPSYLFEEALSSEAVTVVYTQGTAYLGNFLALHNTGESQDSGTKSDSYFCFSLLTKFPESDLQMHSTPIKYCFSFIEYLHVGKAFIFLEQKLDT